MQDKILTVSKVAEILEISQEEVKQLSEDKQLTGYKLGQKTYYLYSDLVYCIANANCSDSADRRKELRGNANSEWTEIVNKYANDEW